MSKQKQSSVEEVKSRRNRKKTTDNPENTEKANEGVIGKWSWKRREQDRGGNFLKINTEKGKLRCKRQNWS